MSANKQLMDALHRALAEGLMKEFELATEDNQAKQRHKIRNGGVPASGHLPGAAGGLLPGCKPAGRMLN